MEHRFSLNTLHWLTKAITLVVCVFILSSCKDPLPNPETTDFIYNDLGQEVKVAQGALSAEEKALKEAKQKLKEAPPRDPLRGPLQREIWKHEHTIVDYRQKALYFGTQQELRKAYDQKTYAAAFEKDEIWPDPKEIAEYKGRKKLQLASRNWEDRVPKFTRYSKKPPSAEGKKEGGEAAPKPEH